MNTKDTLKKYADLVESALDKYIPEQNIAQKTVIDAMRYSLLAGGKRLRPVFVLEFCRVCGGDVNEAMPFACALEMIHTYSLIHDDLPCMDNDDLRRGKPTNHKVFGEDIAVLAGDGLLNAAFETVLNAKETTSLSADKILKASRVLAKCSGMYGMLGGQTIDVKNNGIIPDLNDLKNMYAMKTGALLNAAGQMGCIVGGANDKQLAAAYEYTANIGLAFQIVDDLLDIEGDSALLGKNTGCDELVGKTTFPSIVGIDKAKEIVKELTVNAKNALCEFADTAFLSELADMLASRNH